MRPAVASPEPAAARRTASEAVTLLLSVAALVPVDRGTAAVRVAQLLVREALFRIFAAALDSARGSEPLEIEFHGHDLSHQAGSRISEGQPLHHRVKCLTSASREYDQGTRGLTEDSL